MPDIDEPSAGYKKYGANSYQKDDKKNYALDHVWFLKADTSAYACIDPRL